MIDKWVVFFNEISNMFFSSKLSRQSYYNSLFDGKALLNYISNLVAILAIFTNFLIEIYGDKPLKDTDSP